MPKKIIHQLSLSDIGGVQRSFSLYFSYALKKSNFQHYVYSMHDIIDNFDNVMCVHTNIQKSWINKIKFIYLLFSKNYIIHFYNNLGSKSVQKLLKFFPSSNIIFHERGLAWNAQNEDSETYRYNASKAKIILANSQASKIMLIKKFGIDSQKIKILYNGFLSKQEFFFNDNANRYSERFSVGFVGRLDTPKGAHVFIETAKKMTDYDFFLAGDGILRKSLEKLSQNFKNIHFLGAIKEPMRFISKMDIIVSPSIREPLGNSIIEAGYCKKPVIAPNIDGIPEIIKHGIDGILIDPDKEISFNEILNNAVPLPIFVVNPKTQKLQKPKELDTSKICNAIQLLASDNALRELYGKNLYKSVKEKFNIENYHNTLDEIYKSI